MKNKFLNSFIIITLVLVAFIVYNKFKLSQNSHFTVTADTVIKPGSEISKYVTQEEVDSFSFRYWDIDNNYTKFVNPIAIPLRDALKQKDTNKVLSYLKDNNLSVDIEIEDGTIPLMYSSFYNDLNTTKELINLGANVHKKDKYGLNPMAYAISMGNIDIVKILFNSGVKFEEAPLTQGYILAPSYQNIDKLIIDGDNIKIIYKYNWIQKDYDTPKGGGYMFEHIIYENWTRLAKFILESGYKPYPYVFTGGDHMDYGNSIYDFISKESIESQIEYQKQNNKDNFDLNLFMDKLSYDYTLYKGLEDIPNFEPMLDLLLEHNVSGQPSEELLKKEYERCYENRVNFIKDDYDLYYGNFMAIERLKQYKKEESKAIPISEKEYNRFRPKTLKAYNEFCLDENSTFKSTKEYINYKNWINKTKEISSFINDNRDDSNRVIYFDR
ncbi:ankyrin repeat domain-containing protein [Campylobacter ureolyticus]|uniref:ankyrin repeat domain-containing protein n=1 Tax=Campylobacter ureolyticus TaxID=827 RepID=UPI001FC8CCF8|nr:ankyrin repeat domain-containing protein [Campylobacter ureolyticus]MCZ6106065.1 ankyrin repeat domain-containing protein [Campylobacter ureolyticus]MCZ6158670.1 ankyrin repeat domain-containing protein [Campylobacter ureolyticus]GKH61426.1 hypothetical protein CE91St25_17620 [Campylobacter ureolyticus]